MRRATYGRPRLVKHDGLVLGINLGYGGCAEHERGIEGIQNAFGLQLDGLVGYEARKITKLPNHVYSGRSKTTRGSYLIYEPELGRQDTEIKAGRVVMLKPTPEKIKERLERILTGELSVRDFNAARLTTAWDSNSLGIHGDSEQ